MAFAGYSSLLSLFWSRGHRILGYDAFFYLEHAKRHATGLQRAYASHWPHGFPVAGALLSQLGLSVHTSLWLVSFAALTICCYLTLRLAETLGMPCGESLLLLAGICSIPQVPLLLGGTMPELGCAAGVMVMVYGLAQAGRWWHYPIAGTGALMAFLFRYPGIFCFGVMLLWCIWSWTMLRQRRLGWGAAVATLTSIALGVAFFIHVMAVRGGELHGTSLGRMSGPGLSGVPGYVAALGWSIVSMVSTELVSVRVSASPWLWYSVGLSLVGAFAIPIFHALLRPRSSLSRLAALTVVAYVGTLILVGMIVSWYDNRPVAGRVMVPVLFPFALLLFNSVSHRPSRLAGSLACIALGLLFAARGISPENYAEIGPPKATLEALALDDAKVAVNGPATSMAAYFVYPFALVEDPAGVLKSDATAIVVCSKRVGRRRAVNGPLDPAWAAWRLSLPPDDVLAEAPGFVIAKGPAAP